MEKVQSDLNASERSLSFMQALGTSRGVKNVTPSKATRAQFWEVTTDNLFLVVDMRPTDAQRSRIRVMPYETKEDFDANAALNKHPFFDMEVFSGTDQDVLSQLRAWIQAKFDDPRAQPPYTALT